MTAAREYLLREQRGAAGWMRTELGILNVTEHRHVQRIVPDVWLGIDGTRVSGQRLLADSEARHLYEKQRWNATTCRDVLALAEIKYLRNARQRCCHLSTPTLCHPSVEKNGTSCDETGQLDDIRRSWAISLSYPESLDNFMASKKANSQKEEEKLSYSGKLSFTTSALHESDEHSPTVGTTGAPYTTKPMGAATSEDASQSKELERWEEIIRASLKRARLEIADSLAPLPDPHNPCAFKRPRWEASTQPSIYADPRVFGCVTCDYATLTPAGGLTLSDNAAEPGAKQHSTDAKQQQFMALGRRGLERLIQSTEKRNLDTAPLKSLIARHLAARRAQETSVLPRVNSPPVLARSTSPSLNHASPPLPHMTTSNIASAQQQQQPPQQQQQQQQQKPQPQPQPQPQQHPHPHQLQQQQQFPRLSQRPSSPPIPTPPERVRHAFTAPITEGASLSHPSPPGPSASDPSCTVAPSAPLQQLHGAKAIARPSQSVVLTPAVPPPIASPLLSQMSAPVGSGGGAAAAATGTGQSIGAGSASRPSFSTFQFHQVPHGSSSLAFTPDRARPAAVAAAPAPMLSPAPTSVVRTQSMIAASIPSSSSAALSEAPSPSQPPSAEPCLFPKNSLPSAPSRHESSLMSQTSIPVMREQPIPRPPETSGSFLPAKATSLQFSQSQRVESTPLGVPNTPSGAQSSVSWTMTNAPPSHSNALHSSDSLAYRLPLSNAMLPSDTMLKPYGSTPPSSVQAQGGLTSSSALAQGGTALQYTKVSPPSRDGKESTVEPTVRPPLGAINGGVQQGITMSPSSSSAPSPAPSPVITHGPSVVRPHHPQQLNPPGSHPPSAHQPLPSHYRPTFTNVLPRSSAPNRGLSQQKNHPSPPPHPPVSNTGSISTATFPMTVSSTRSLNSPHLQRTSPLEHQTQDPSHPGAAPSMSYQPTPQMITLAGPPPNSYSSSQHLRPSGAAGAHQGAHHDDRDTQRRRKQTDSVRSGYSQPHIAESDNHHDNAQQHGKVVATPHPQRPPAFTWRSSAPLTQHHSVHQALPQAAAIQHQRHIHLHQQQHNPHQQQHLQHQQQFLQQQQHQQQQQLQQQQPPQTRFHFERHPPEQQQQQRPHQY